MSKRNTKLKRRIDDVDSDEPVAVEKNGGASLEVGSSPPRPAAAAAAAAGSGYGDASRAAPRPAAAAAAASSTAPRADVDAVAMAQAPAAAAAAASAAKNNPSFEQAVQEAKAQMGALWLQLVDEKKAFTDNREKEANALAKWEQERPQFGSKAEDLRAQFERTEALLNHIREALQKNDAAEIRRALTTDPATLVKRPAPAVPASPLRPGQKGSAMLSSPTKSARYDPKASVLAMLRNLRPWPVTGPRNPDPSKPCRACSRLDHWLADYEDDEWKCDKVRLYAPAPSVWEKTLGQPAAP